MFFVWQNEEKERKQKIEIYRDLPGRSADLTKFLPYISIPLDAAFTEQLELIYVPRVSF